MINGGNRMLPKGWTWVKLGRMGKLTQGGTPSTDVEEFWKGTIPFITGADVTKLFIENARSYLTDKGIESGKTQKCEKGDLLIVSRTRVGRIGIAATTLGVSQDVSAIKLKDRYHNKYIAIYLSSLPKYLQESSQGAIIKGLTRGFLENLEIPVPPTVDDQFTIANKLEKKAINIEEMRRAALRQKEAAEAMQGVILRKIFPFKEGDVLPDGWKWSELGRISANIQYGISKGSSQTPSGPKLLRITDIQNGNADWSSVPYCECNDTETRRYLLQDGDIVFVRTGATTGKSFLITAPDNALFASYLIRVQCDHNFINPTYLYSFFQSPIYWNYISQGSRGGTLAGFNATMLSKMRIPYPVKRDDQISIANMFTKKMMDVEKLRLTANRQLEAIEAMPAAMLREVFDFDAETGAAI